jgi:hypothetical protein
VNSETVEYHQVCRAHGLIASAAVLKRLPPNGMSCPVCGQYAELWVGAAKTVQRRKTAPRR